MSGVPEQRELVAPPRAVCFVAERVEAAAGEAVIALADLRERCILTTWDPDTLEQDVDVSSP